jgi:DNA-binding Xre family transcriptional regulator
LKKSLKYDILSLNAAITDFDSDFCEMDKLAIGVKDMAVSYKKLWKILIDRDMKKKDLCAAAGISHASMAKLGKNENVTIDVLVKICTALQCDIGDIVELTPELLSKQKGDAPSKNV